MRELLTYNMWEVDAEAYCVTTNGVTRNHQLVMGAGCALEAKKMFYRIASILGGLVEKNGNNVYYVNETLGDFKFDGRYYKVVSFPTKHHYKDKSDLGLIEKSAMQLLELIEKHGWKTVVLPRPGCGLGGLVWETEVKPVLQEVWGLDNRIVVVHNGK